ncbi:MAG: MFS transporter [Acidimicrobiales bacterium]|jgi:Na+/melibiose symporter-like transporter
MKELLKQKNARIYLAGQSFSLLGDTSLWLALGIWVKELTGSAGQAGLVFFFFALSGLFAPIAGLVVDRVRRRPLLFWVNLLTGVMVLALFAVHSRDQVWVIYVVMFFYGLSYCFLGSGQSALLKVMLPEELLGDANGMLSTVREGLRLVAPLVGAGLFAVVGGHVIAVIDAGTFFVASASLLFVRVDERVVERPTEGVEAEAAHWWAEVTAGIRHIWRTTVLRQILIGTSIALMVVGFFESLCFAIVQHGLHRPPTFLGVLLAVQGCGAVGGGLSAAAFMRRAGPGVMVGIGLSLLALGSTLLIPASMPFVFVGIVLVGISIPWIVVGIYTVLQLRTPNDLQGRVYSAADTVLSVPQTFSIGLGAILVSFVDYRLLLVLVAFVLAMSAVYLLTRSEQRVGLEQAPVPAVAAGSSALPATPAGPAEREAS